MIDEDAPAVNAGSGNIAGIGVPNAQKGANFGEPGVKRYKGTKTPLLFPKMMKRSQPNVVAEETFAGAKIFEVSSKLFHNLTLQKRKGKHWRTYLEEDDCYAEIREWARKSKGPIVVRNESTGEMRYVRYSKG